MASATSAGPRSRRARSGSSRTPTGAPNSASCRWTRASSPGGGAIHASVSMAARPAGTTPSCARSGHEPTASRPTSAAPRAWRPRTSDGWPGPVRRSGPPATGRPHRGRPPMTTPLARLLLGRRRTVRGPRARPVRGCAGRGERRADGALAAPRQPQQRDRPDRRPQRTGRDPGHVRWRDAGGRPERGRTRGQERGSRRDAGDDDGRRARERARHPRRQPVGRQGAGPQAPGRGRRGRRRRRSPVPVAQGWRRSPAGSRPRRANAG